MYRRTLVCVLVVIAACQPDVTGPETRPLRSVAHAVDEGPSAPHSFGPDTYRIGLFSLATFDVPLSEDLVIAGMPTVSFHASSVAARVQLNVRLFEVDAAGKKQLITRGTITLEGAPVGEVDVVTLTYGNFWRAEAGHTLRLELTNVDSPDITPSRLPSETTVTGLRLEIPVR